MDIRAKISEMPRAEEEDLGALFGVEYFEPGASAVIEARPDDLYYYKTYIGAHDVAVEYGDCIFWISDDNTTVFQQRGPVSIKSRRIATVIRGYMPENKSSEIVTKTSLPYVNGCSTKQVFPPERLGDPTMQILDMPPYSSEQAHHIHSTVRVVYVLKGSGRSVVGMDVKTIKEALYPGKVILLQKMSPHHFETDGESLVVLPLHVWSSVGQLESNHPMFNGTHMI